MAKITIMKGLPASGKSTKAKELIEKYGGTVRINKDLLRTMLHFDKWSGKNEGLTQDAARMLVRGFIEKGVNVIIDDTNLNPNTVQSWKDLARDLGASISYEEVITPVEECISRDYAREKQVGKHTILKMALQRLDYMKGEKVVVCDLDGTLCNIEHRLKFTRTDPKDWKSFFEGIKDDTLNVDVLDKVLAYEEQGCKVIFVSARPENYREATEVWLENAFNGYTLATALIMREANDKRVDTEVKSDIYDKYLSKLNIVKVFDDRPSVIRMWREKGLDVEDCGSGEEF